jgi:hypothetical protein
METVKAEHTVGDRIHAKLYYADDRSCLVYLGNVIRSTLHKGVHFPDRVLYDIELEQADAPPIVITNLTKGFVLKGGEEVFDQETGAYIGEDPREKKGSGLLPAFEQLLKPVQP